LLHHAVSRAELPTAGDWVAVRAHPDGDPIAGGGELGSADRMVEEATRADHRQLALLRIDAKEAIEGDGDASGDQPTGGVRREWLGEESAPPEGCKIHAVALLHNGRSY